MVSCSPNTDKLHNQTKLDEADCLWIHLRLIDLSLDYKNLSAYSYEKQLHLEAGANAGQILFETLSKGVLPEYLIYTLACNSSTDGQGPEDLPSMQQDTGGQPAIAYQQIASSLMPRFPGKEIPNATFVGGFLLLYTKDLLRVHSGSDPFDLITGTGFSSPCGSVSAHQLSSETQANTSSLLVLCTSSVSSSLT